MKASDLLIKKIKEFEGFKLESYKCPAGVWTIGAGHTKGVKPGMTISEKQAETLLRGDLLEVEKGVENLYKCNTQGEFDALVDFAFNLGIERLKSSTLLKRILRKDDEDDIRQEFSRWIFAGGKIMNGLIIRRKWEADRFFSV